MSFVNPEDIFFEYICFFKLSTMVARGKLIHDAIPARLKLRKFDIFGWLKLKLLQYNISSCLYMLDTWERLLFNFFFLVMLMLSVFLFVTYLSTASTTFLSGIILLFVISSHIFIFLFTAVGATATFCLVLLILLCCPLHQF